MKISVEKLESLFYGDGTLKDVLPALKEELEKCDYYRGIMMQNVTDNAEECKRALNEMTGLFDIVEKAYEFSEGALDVAEPEADYKLRVEDEKKTEGKKKTDGAIKALAAREVSQYRRVRAYLLGYVKGLEKSIGTLQSILKYEGTSKGVSRASQDSTQP